MIDSYITCHDCGQAHHQPHLSQGFTAYCRRCGGVLTRHRPPTFERALALTLAGLILFFLANFFPFLGIQFGSISQETTLITGTIELFLQGKWMLSLLVFFTSILAPGLLLVLMLSILLPLHFGRVPSYLPQAFRFVGMMRMWTLMDVFMLAILVAAIKMASLASLVPGIALVSFLILIFILAGAQAAIDTDRIWTMVTVPRLNTISKVRGEAIQCMNCHLNVAAPVASSAKLSCPRCFAPLFRRKPASLQRTWALLLAAIIFYIPANLMPVMYVTELGNVEADTIMSGVLYFLSSGEWYLALIIFIASIFVPFVKICILIYLLLSVQRKSRVLLRQRTQIYRVVEIIGRWSMLDVFVVSILVAMVQFGNLSNIEAGWGAVFFGAVVVLTMFAAMSFDPRLIWDAMDEKAYD